MRTDRVPSFESLEARALFSAAPGLEAMPGASSQVAPSVVAANTTDAGESIATATNLGQFFAPRVRTVGQSVGAFGDNHDYFKFRVAKTMHVTITLTGMADDLDLTLDRLNGTFVGNSLTDGNGPESITRVLTPGWYAIEVSPFFFGETSYVLKVRATDLPADAGNTLAAATPLAAFNAPRSVEVAQMVGQGSDSGDWYKFRVNRTMKFEVKLTNLSADVDLALYRSNNVQIDKSVRTGTRNEDLTRTLTPGWYYLRVDPYQTAVSSYALKVTAKPAASPAAAAIASAQPARASVASRDVGERGNAAPDLLAMPMPALVTL